MAFIWVDYLVCILMLLVSSAIGIYFRFTGGKQKTTREFLLANKSANVFVVACSLMATFMSSITLLGVSAEIYTFGTQFVIINLSYILFSPVAAYLYIPVFYKLGAISVYEYLEKRFGIITRMVTSSVFCIQMILYMGIVVYAPALALEAVTGIKNIYAIFIIGIVCTFYAGLGGMKAVLFTDMLQALLMLSAVLCVVLNAAVEVGLSGVWRIAGLYKRLEFGNFSLDPTTRHTWWSLIFGGGFTFMSLYAVNQAQVQRYLSLKDVKTAQKAVYIHCPILIFLSVTTCFAGLAIFSKYYRCDPVLTKRISSSDQLMPRYVLDTMDKAPGVSGIFVAGIFGGALSTMSSALNSLAAVSCEDYIKPAYRYLKQREIEETSATICSKLLCLAYGLLCVCMAFMSKYLGAILQSSLTIFGIVGGPILGVYTLGMFVPLANEIGALTGLVFGTCFGFWFGFGRPRPPLQKLPTYSSAEGCKDFPDIKVNVFVNSTAPTINTSDYLYVYRVSYQWYIIISFIITLGIGAFASWIIQRTKYAQKMSPPELFVPPIAKYLEKKKKKSEVHEIEMPATESVKESVSERTASVPADSEKKASDVTDEPKDKN